MAALLSLVPALSVSQTGPTLVVKVVHVVDGDTIEVCCIGGKGEKVRYIGINTPETKHPTKGIKAFGKEAGGGQPQAGGRETVRLDFDVQ